MDASILDSRAEIGDKQKKIGYESRHSLSQDSLCLLSGPSLLGVKSLKRSKSREEP